LTVEFRYEAVDRTGRAVNGVRSGANELEVLQALRQQDLTPVDIAPMKPADRSGRRSSAAPSAQQVVLVVRELSTLLGAGVPLAEAVESTMQSHAEDGLGAAFERALARLRAGAPFSEALRATGLAFPDYLFHLVGAGELTGRLSQALNGAAEQMEYEQRVRADIRNALVYPSVLVVSGIAATLLIFIVVVPKFGNILKSSQATVPAISRGVLEAGLFARDNLLWLGLAAAAAVGGAGLALANPAVRQQLLETASRLPLLGDWLRHAEVGRWAKMLGTLLGNKVPVIRAMELALSGVRLGSLGQQLRLAQRDLQAGQKMADALATHRAVSTMGVNLVRVGERTGDLPLMLATLARVYEEASRDRMKRFLVLLEPLTILIVGAAIGFIMIAIILAITSLSSVAA
jgi:general secretion pathway protein F